MVALGLKMEGGGKATRASPWCFGADGLKGTALVWSSAMRAFRDRLSVLFPYKKMLVSFGSGLSFTASLGKRKGFLGREVWLGIFNLFGAALLFSSPPSRQPFCLKHTHLVFFFFFFFSSFSLYV